MPEESENEKLKKEVEHMFNNLYENKVIYDERLTLLCEFVSLETQVDSFKVELKVIKALRKEAHHELMFQHITSKPTFSVGAMYKFANYKYVNGNKIGGPYCCFEIFTDFGLVEKVCKMNEEEIEIVGSRKIIT